VSASLPSPAALAIMLSVLLASCGPRGETASSQTESADSKPEASVAETGGVAIPDSLAPFGDGYPASGDPCRRLGESAATIDYLDDSAILVGCPDAESAAALGGEVLDVIGGVTLVSISTGDANAGLAEMQSSTSDYHESEDALVPGTDYHATAPVPCGFGGSEPTSTCQAGVKRNWGEDGTALVEIEKPDGFKRAIFFRGTTPYGADSAEADGSASWSFEVTRRDDQSIIEYGPETYVIFDALVVGG
jgi:hypothetical protein